MSKSKTRLRAEIAALRAEIAYWQAKAIRRDRREQNTLLDLLGFANEGDLAAVVAALVRAIRWPSC
jgi:hypothetical protein